MFNEVYSSHNSHKLNSLQIAARARVQEKNLALLVAGYKKVEAAPAKRATRSLVDRLVVLFAGMR